MEGGPHRSRSTTMNVRSMLIVATAVSIAGCGGTDAERSTPQTAGSATVQTAAPPELPYLGQAVPGLTPELFAPGVVSTDAIELNAVFSPDGREFFLTRIVDGLDTMHQMTFVVGKWGEARQLLLFPDHVRVESADMVLSSDGLEMYFLAHYDHADTGPAPNYDLWVSRRVSSDWTGAELVGPPISTAANEYYPTLGADGSLYFVSDRDGTRN
jgi:WD40-like Beta Propeller Repeat